MYRRRSTHFRYQPFAKHKVRRSDLLVLLRFANGMTDCKIENYVLESICHKKALNRLLYKLKLVYLQILLPHVCISRTTRSVISLR